MLNSLPMVLQIRIGINLLLFQVCSEKQQTGRTLLWGDEKDLEERQALHT
jgi:hypothetical protein